MPQQRQQLQQLQQQNGTEPILLKLLHGSHRRTRLQNGNTPSKRPQQQQQSGIQPILLQLLRGSRHRTPPKQSQPQQNGIQLIQLMLLRPRPGSRHQVPVLQLWGKSLCAEPTHSRGPGQEWSLPHSATED